MNAVALTDHGRAGGLLKFKKACETSGIKPIYGFEAYVAPESHLTKEKIESHRKTSYHLTLLAKNTQGLENIFQLTSIGWRQGFYYKPRISFDLLKKHQEGLIILSGCGSGRLSQYIMDAKPELAIAHIKEMKDVWGDDFYIEVQNHGLDWQQPLRKRLFELSEITTVPPVATQDSHYPTRGDAKLHEAICRLAAGDLTFDSDESYFKSHAQMCESFDPEEHHAITRTQEVADKCNCNWSYGKTIWPVFELSPGVTPEAELRTKATEGFKRLFGDGDTEYRERLEEELSVIQTMGLLPISW